MEKLIYVVMPGNRYAGLMSYFVQAISNLKLVDNTEHKMYFKYDHNMRYLDLTQGGNVWEYYFEQPFTLTQNDIETHKILKDVWFDGGLIVPQYPSSEINNIAFNLIQKYVKLKPHITEKINNFLNTYTNPSDKILSIHKRGTDHINDSPETPLHVYFKAVDEIIDNYQKLLVCSDEQYSVDIFKKRYGSNRVISYDSIRALEKTTIGIHQSMGLLSPYKMGEDVIIETFLMSKTHKMIKTVSNVSNSALLLNPNIEYIQLDEYEKPT